MTAVSVGVVGPVYPDSFADNVLDALRRSGHIGVALGSPYPRPHQRSFRVAVDAACQFPMVGEWAQSRFVDKVVEARVNIVLALESSLGPLAVRELRRHGVTMCLWFPDALSNFERQLMFAAPYDHVFLKDPLLVARLKGLLGDGMHYLPEACNPRWHHPSPRVVEVERCLVVVGNLYPLRVRLVERLLLAGIPIRIYGPPPARNTPDLVARCHVGRYVVREEKAEVFERAAGVLNNLHPSELESVNCRVFEAAASGGVVLCEQRAALGDLFEPDIELLTFRTFDDLVDRCRSVLNEPDQFAELRRSASQRAHRDHSYDARLVDLFAVLNGGKK